MATVHVKDITDGLISEKDKLDDLTPDDIVENDTDLDTLKEDANTVLTIAGIFALIVAVFISISFRRLFSDPTAKLVRQIFTEMVLIQSPSAPIVTMSADKPDIGPRIFAFVINIFWFSSFILFLMSAGGAALLKRWTAECVRQKRGDRSKEARSDAPLLRYYAGLAFGIRLDRTAMCIIDSLHAGVGCFSCGLMILLYTVSFGITIMMFFVLGTTTFIYVKLSSYSLKHQNFPFHTPLTSRLSRTRKLKSHCKAQSLKKPGDAEASLPQWNTSLELSGASDCRPRSVCLVDENLKVDKPYISTGL